MKKKEIYMILVLIAITVLVIVLTNMKPNIKEDNKNGNKTQIVTDKIDKDVIKNVVPVESEKDKGKVEDNYIQNQAVIITNEDLNNKFSNNQILDDIKIESTSNIDGLNLSNGKYMVIVTSEKYTTQEIIDKLKEANIDATPNYITKATGITNDKYVDFQWALENKGQSAGTVGADINPIATDGTEEKVIVVVDSGVDYTHSDLANVMWVNNTGTLTGTHGMSYIYDGETSQILISTDPMDDNGHGSHCAGIIAGSAGFEGGISGAALEASNIKIMALKTLDSTGSGTLATALLAYDYISEAQDAGVNIIGINNSWGIGSALGATSEAMLKEAIDNVGEKGALSICAAGNDSKDTDTNPMFPANIDSEYVITVSSSSINDELSDFSNYGAVNSNIAAPGSEILSTVPQYVFNPSIYTDSEKTALCLPNYEDGEDGTLAFSIIPEEGTALYLSNDKFFGASGSSALEWYIPSAVANETYCLYIPLNGVVTDENQYFSAMYNYYGPTSATGYDATLLMTHYNSSGYPDVTDEGYMDTIGATTVGEASTQWGHASKRIGSTDGYIIIELRVNVAGDYSIFLDDIAFSKAGVSESNFGKYGYKDGTSMATPYVTGAVASLANRFDGASPLDIKNVILTAVRPSEYLEGKVSTGGVLDLSQIPLPTLELPTNVNDAVWHKSSNESVVNERIEVKGTTKGGKYEFSLDEGSTWNLCTYDEATNKYYVTLTSEGVHKINVREQNIEGSSDGYIYKVDASRPEITINGEKENPDELELVATDALSGIPANQVVQYIFSTTNPEDDATWLSATLDNNHKAKLTLPTEDGTYNIYVKPITDNVGWTSSSNETHIFSSYVFETVIPVTGISLNKNSTKLDKDATEKLEATISPSDATNKDVIWISNNENVVTVDENGNLTAIGNGTATITVSSSENADIKATCEVKVVTPMTNVTLSNTNIELKNGRTYLLEITKSPNEASIKSKTFTSTDTNVVTVNDNGLITAVGIGTANINVTVEDESGNTRQLSCSVTVKSNSSGTGEVSIT